MKRVLMAVLVATVLAVAVPFAPVQVHEANATPDCVARDQNDDGYFDMTDIVMLKVDLGGQGKIKLIQHFFGTAC